MVLKIHGHAVAPLVRLVAEVCEEKKVPYEIVHVAVYKGEHKTLAFKQFQPFGQVPYIDDDGFILYEARAICRYIVKKYEGQGTPGLMPTDPKDEALFEQAASIEYSNFYPFALGLSNEKIIKKSPSLTLLNAGKLTYHYCRHRGLPEDEARVNEYLANLNSKLEAYEEILGKQSYLAGDSVTLADLFHLPYAAIVIDELGYNVLQNRPNVARWWKEISTRPAWLTVKVTA